MTEAETVARLVALLASDEPFLHVRFGDGDVFFATGTGPRVTADGEEWTPRLQDQLRWAWKSLALYPGRLLLGDVESYALSDGCEPQWRALLGELLDARLGAGLAKPEMTHMEALRVGVGYALPFYQAVRDHPRRKAYVAPDRLSPLAAALGADHVPVPLHVAHAHTSEVVTTVLQRGYDLILFSAGRGGKIMQGRLALASPDTRQVDVGSGLDLLVDDGVRRGIDGRVDERALRAAYRAAGLGAGA